MKVLVTGGSGFLGKHCLDYLLQHGHTVVSTVRSHDKAKALLNDFPTLSSQLSFCIVEDMSVSGAFDEAVVSVPPFDAVIHTASPFHYHAQDPRKDMIDPAINGTTEILQAIQRRAPSIKRVVITSSFVTVLNMSKPIVLYTEDMWSPITMEQALSGGVLAYMGSKKFAEQAAWDFMKSQKPRFILSTINPTLIFGPVTNHPPSLEKINTSNEVFRDIIQEKMKVVIPPFTMPFVDVRDVALAHVRAIEVPEADAAGRRFLISAGLYSNHEVAKIIKDNFPQLADRLPDQIDIPDPTSFEIDTTGVTKVLGVSLRPLKETVVATVNSLLKVSS